MTQPYPVSAGTFAEGYIILGVLSSSMVTDAFPSTGRYRYPFSKGRVQANPFIRMVVFLLQAGILMAKVL